MENAVEIPAEIKEIERKTHFTGKVIKTTLAGAIVDVGLAMPGVVHISRLQKEPVKQVGDVVQVGDQVDVWVRQVNKKTGRVDLTMIEPLAVEWSDIKKGSIITGSVVRLEKFGAFVEIGAERPGLVHISELTHDYIREVSDAVKVGDEVKAMVLDIDRRKKQIKLSLKALTEDPAKISIEEDDEEDSSEPIPTAMEIALRKAMDGSSSTGGTAKEQSKTKAAKSSKEMEDILTRTLQHKVRTE
ncbi:MAG: S1 RNA-binding domain-containing protein [Anaerolineae bacterium]|nr:S1 RNA-binding domain-containing protein [Anaerolineae bacterium]